MTEINLTPAETAKPVKVSLKKLTDGIGIVFMGVLTMLEAMEASGREKLLDSLDQKGAADVVTPAKEAGSGAEDGTPDSHAPAASGSSGSADDIPANNPANTTESTIAAPSAGLTVDDVTKIVVQKIKSNPGANDKIRALVIAHGAQRVTDLKPEVFEAFLTDLAQL